MRPIQTLTSEALMTGFETAHCQAMSRSSDAPGSPDPNRSGRSDRRAKTRSGLTEGVVKAFEFPLRIVSSAVQVDRANLGRCANARVVADVETRFEKAEAPPPRATAQADPRAGGAAGTRGFRA